MAHINLMNLYQEKSKNMISLHCSCLSLVSMFLLAKSIGGLCTISPASLYTVVPNFMWYVQKKSSSIMCCKCVNLDIIIVRQQLRKSSEVCSYKVDCVYSDLCGQSVVGKITEHTKSWTHIFSKTKYPEFNFNFQFNYSKNHVL